MRVLIAALLVSAALCSSASGAPVRALAPAGAGPVIDGNAVWFESGGGVLTEPLWGGPRTAAAPAGVLAPLSPPLGESSPFAVVDPVQSSDLGVVTLEDGGVWLRRDGRRVEIALPPGADPSVVAVAGGLGVAPVPEGALVVFDLRSGVEVRQVSLGALDPVNLDGLALSPAGDVAATVPVGDGTGALVWAAAGESRVRVIARGERLGRVAVAGRRVAHVTGAGLREGVRVVVVDPGAVRDAGASAGRPASGTAGAAAASRAAAPRAAAPRAAAPRAAAPRAAAPRAAAPRAAGAALSPADRGEVLRGPAVYDVTSLSFDGAWVGFSTPTCLYVASGSGATLPAGPCVRTEIAAEPLRGDAPRLRVACINAPSRTCRVRASAGGSTVTRTVRRGQARVVTVPRGRLQVRTVDPDGRVARVL